MRRTPVVLFLLLFLAGSTAAVTSAGAIHLPSHPFRGEMPVAPLTTNASQTNKTSLAAVMGALEMSGNGSGTFAFSGTSLALATEIGRLEVYLVGDNKSARNPANLLQGGRIPAAIYSNVSLVVSNNATVYYLAPEALHTVSVSADFGIGLVLHSPDDLGGAIPGLREAPSLAWFAPSAFHAEMAKGEQSSTLFARDANTTLTVFGPNATRLQNYTGATHVFRLVEGARVLMGARQALYPLDGNLTSTFRPAPRAQVAKHFDPVGLPDALGTFFGNATNPPKLPFDARTLAALRAAAPVLDGAVVATFQGNVTVGADSRTLGGLTLYRFDALTLRDGPGDDRLLYEGRGPFLLAGSQLYSTQRVWGRALPVPLLSIVLWVLAGAALVASFLLKPFVGPTPAAAAAPLWAISLGVHLGLAVVGFVLWDFEIRRFFGTSLLAILFGPDTGGGYLTPTVAAVELLPYTLATFFFGQPIKYLVNSVLRLLSFKRAFGIGRGLGHLATWGLGAPFIPVFLNSIVGLLVSRLAPGV